MFRPLLVERAAQQAPSTGAQPPAPDLSQVDEVGFVDLMPGRARSGGYVNVASFEAYGTPVKRGGGH